MSTAHGVESAESAMPEFEPPRAQLQWSYPKSALLDNVAARSAPQIGRSDVVVSSPQGPVGTHLMVVTLTPLSRPLPSSLSFEASETVSLSAFFDKDGIRADYTSHGLVVPNSVESLDADITLIFDHTNRCRVCESNVEFISDESEAKEVKNAGLESQIVVQKASLVARVAAVRTDTQDRQAALEAKLIELDVEIDTAGAELNLRVEEVNALTKGVEDRYEQLEAIRQNATRMMANVQAVFGSGSIA